MVGTGLLHHTATADAVPLPPLGSQAALGGSTVYAADGKTVLAVLHASQDRKPIALTQVSKVLITAVLDTEDHRFYLHGGFDIPSTIRALAADSSGDGGIQGGSTITQQLVKQTYLTSVRKLSRKIKEAVLADRLERKYTKDQILQAYLNTIYLGNGAYGVEAAANVYFNEHASQLTLPQAALLAGLIQNPSGYDPILAPPTARTRRAEVLARMVHYGDITAAQAAAANRVPLPTSVVEPPVGRRPDQRLLRAGSPDRAAVAREPPRRHLRPALRGPLRGRPQDLHQPQSRPAGDWPSRPSPATPRPTARASSRPWSPSIRPPARCWPWSAAQGVQNSHYDIITQGTRQPGSGFKLFTLLAALQQGYSIYDTLDAQSPCAIDFPTDHDLVQPPGPQRRGQRRRASSPCSTPPPSRSTAPTSAWPTRSGCPTSSAWPTAWASPQTLPEYPSIVIGSDRRAPHRDGRRLRRRGRRRRLPRPVVHRPHRGPLRVRPSTSGQIPATRWSRPRSPRRRPWRCRPWCSTAPAPAAALYNRPVAGKTGTTNNNVDAWFNGFTPQLETTVWMGNGNAEVPMVDVGGVGEVYGGTFPAHTWHDFMTSAAGQPAGRAVYRRPTTAPCRPRNTSPRRPGPAMTSSTTTTGTRRRRPTPTPTRPTRPSLDYTPPTAPSHHPRCGAVRPRP